VQHQVTITMDPSGVILETRWRVLAGKNARECYVATSVRSGGSSTTEGEERCEANEEDWLEVT
jgi:hypothetical protein